MKDHESPVDAEAERQALARAAAYQLFASAAPVDARPAADPSAAPVDAPPSADATEGDEEGNSSELLGWTKDAEKVRLTLLAVHDLEVEGKVSALDAFVTALADKLSWQGLRRRQIGAIFATLGRRGYVVKVFRGSIPLGYALTAEGRRFIQDLVPPAEADAAALAPAALPSDPARLAAALTGIAQQYATAGQKLQENRARRAQLLAEVERLDAEAAELSRVIDHPEIQALLQRLIQLAGSSQGCL